MRQQLRPPFRWPQLSRARCCACVFSKTMYVDRHRYTVFRPYTVCQPNNKTKITRAHAHTRTRANVFWGCSVCVFSKTMYVDRHRYTVFRPYTVCRPNTKTKITRTHAHTRTRAHAQTFFWDVSIRNSLRSNKDKHSTFDKTCI